MTYYERYSKATSAWELSRMLKYDIDIVYMFAKPFEDVSDKIAEIRKTAMAVCNERGWTLDAAEYKPVQMRV